MTSDIVILGFPKCGTSALFRSIESRKGRVRSLRAEDGHIELPWPQFRSVTTKASEGKFRLHKFPGYVFNDKALDYLSENLPGAVFVLCIRDPRKALVSWWNQHRRIAQSRKPVGHFANREREFYADCSLKDYYEYYARERLRYDVHFRNVMARIRDQKVVVVAQERMAQGLDPISEHILDIANGQSSEPPSDLRGDSDEGHKGFADSADVALDRDAGEDLQAGQINLYRMVANSRAHSIL